MAPNVKLHFFAANDINGDVLHEITDEDTYFKKLVLKLERDGLGGAELVLARSVNFAGFGSGTFQPEVFVRLVIAAYSDTIYYPWGFFLDKRQQTVVHVLESGAEEFHFGGPGPKMYLDRSALGIEQLTGATFWNLDLENGVWRWGESATVGRVLNRIYQEDQARTDPALPDLTLGFDQADDSDGNPWTDSDLGGPDQFELPIGHSLLKALWDIDDVVELTSWIELGTVATPIFELNVSEGLGLDKTGSAFGAGVCLLKEGVNIADDSLTTQGASLKKVSHVIVEGKDGNWVEVERPTFTSGDYVKIAKITYNRQNSDFWLEKAGLRWLQRQDYGEKELSVEILPGASDATGLYFPAPNRNLWLSNLISVDTSADGMTHSPLDIQPSEDQLVTGLLLETHTASDDSSATAKARSWDVTVYLNRERPGNVSRTPDQRSAASGGGDCKCLKLCSYSSVLRTDTETWRVLEHASLAGGEINPEPADWKEVGFDDRTWAIPTPSLSDPSALVDVVGPNAASLLRRHEFFYRKEIYVPQSQIDAGGNLRLQYYADDGATVYVNGTQVSTIGTQWNAGPHTVDTTVAVSNFVTGLNCIAVYLWNQGNGTDGTAPNPGGTILGLQLDIQWADHEIGEHPNAARCDHGHHADLVPITDLGGYTDAETVEDAIADLYGIVDGIPANVSQTVLPHLLTAHVFPIFAHHGDLNQTDGYPENTEEAFLQAVLRGVHGVEIDLMRSSSGTFHAHHDLTVDRTTDGTGDFDSKTDAQIAALNIDGGQGYNAARHGTSLDVPTLDRVLDAVLAYDPVLLFDLKEDVTGYTAGAGHVAGATALASYVVTNNLIERTMILVYSIAGADAVKAVEPAIPVGLVTDTDFDVETEPNVDRLYANHTRVTDLAFVTARQPKPVDAWPLSMDGIDERSVMQDMFDRGARSWTTNNVAAAMRYWADVNGASPSAAAIAAIGRWEPVTAGVDIFVWDGSDIVVTFVEN